MNDDGFRRCSGCGPTSVWNPVEDIVEYCLLCRIANGDDIDDQGGETDEP